MSNAVGHWLPSTADPAAFKRSLPSELPFVHLSFDSISNNNLTATGSHPAVSKLHPRLIKGTSKSLVDGKSGKVVWIEILIEG